MSQMRRVGVWRGGVRPGIAVPAPFVWRCLSGSAVAPFPHPPHRTGQAHFWHPALGQDLTPSSTARRAQAGSDVRAQKPLLRGGGVDSSRLPPDFVLEAQPPAQPRRRVGIKRSIRLADGAYRKVVRPSAQHAVHLAHQRRGLLPCSRSARSAHGSSRPRAECFSLTAGSRCGPGRSSPKTFARTCIPGNDSLSGTLQMCLLLVHRQLQLAHDLAQALQGRFGLAPSAQDHEIVGLGHEPRGEGSLEPEHLPSQHEPPHVNIGQQRREG